MNAIAQGTRATQHLSVLPARESHIERLLPRVRAADRAELWAGWRHTPEQSLRYGLKHSSHVWTGCIECEPVCMAGVVPGSILSGTGAPWLIGTEALIEHQFTFLRCCRGQLARLQRVYQHLANHVAADNTAAVRWLTWLGFTVHAAAPFGPDGVPFRLFEWRAEDV